jgi:hypothetical protein
MARGAGDKRSGRGGPSRPAPPSACGSACALHPVPKGRRAALAKRLSIRPSVCRPCLCQGVTLRGRRTRERRSWRTLRAAAVEFAGKGMAPAEPERRCTAAVLPKRPSFAKLYIGEMRRKPGQGHLKEAPPDLGRRSRPG